MKTLSHLPPDMKEQARLNLEKIGEALAARGCALLDDAKVREALGWPLAFSDFVAQQCLRSPLVLDDLRHTGDLDRACAADDYRRRLAAYWLDRTGQPAPQVDPADAPQNQSVQSDQNVVAREDLQRILRGFRNREMLRIAIRDIGERADLSQTLSELSRLADACIQVAIAQLYLQQVAVWGAPLDDQGNPQQLLVLGLGKLGADELNFSSDVDLMFAYPREGRTCGGTKGTLSNEEFFLRICRDLIQVIGARTADGFVFRVDTRLRPFGEVGPLALSFDKLEEYYLRQGREWERYALIKARVVAGPREIGNRLLDRLRPFIFRRYLDYGAFDALRDMKARIALEVRNKNLEDNIKLGSGGIREIEFFGQMFQLIRGGVEPALQISGIRNVLTVLVQKGYIPAEVGQSLDEAYVFLRTVENRLQQWSDQQTHHLPADAAARRRLAACMGFDTWDAFLVRLNHFRRQVHEHFNELLAPKTDQNSAMPEKDALKALEGLWRGLYDAEGCRTVLKDLGYTDTESVLRLVEALRAERTLKNLSANGHERLNRLLPLLLQAVGKAQEPELVLGRVFDLIKSIQRRTSYLALLLEYPAALSHLVRLSEASPWIARFLSQHPVLLDELLDPRTLYKPPHRESIREELDRRLEAIDAGDVEYQMEALRVFKQIHELRVAASDITDVLPLMKVSDHLSDIAEIVLAKVVQLCWQNLSERYGTPRCRSNGRPSQRGFAVIAYGKLGGLELGYGSDLDLVFLHAAEPGQTNGADRSLDNAQFFSRLGQRVLHFLTTHTSAGVLYQADMRLRPNSTSGLLVSHIHAFRDYQLNDAWVWEHQALIRARAVTGDPDLRQEFDAIRTQILTQPRDARKLAGDVAGMRERLRQANPPLTPGTFDIKHGRGGIVDIEFLVQYLVLRHAHDYPEIIRWTDNVRLLQALNESGILDDNTAFGLRRAYLIYRALVHRLNLRHLPAQVQDRRFDAARRFVVKTWNQHL